MRSYRYWRRVVLSLLFVLALSCTSCGLTATIFPRTAMAGRPDTFIEVVRIVESAYWDAAKVTPQTLLKGAVSGMEPDLVRQQGHISHKGTQMVVSLSGQTKAIQLTAIESTHEFVQAFADIHSFVLQHQRSNGEPIKWEYRAIEGMLKSLDPNSAFMPPPVFREMQDETKGSFGGIGIRIGMEEGEVVILEPIEGTPASKAGLKAGDHIVKIDGSLTKELTLQEAVRRMRGPVATRLVLSIRRAGLVDLEDVPLTRAKIEIKTVESRVLDGRIGYVKVRSFHETTYQETERALGHLAQQKVKGLILDLRNNPGGLLSQSVKVCNLFVDEGRLVVYTEGRLRNQNSRFLANAAGQYRQYPLIVLINSGSASGSEIVAGALQDLQKATLVGTKSYGKGSVQTIFPLHDGSGLRLTTAHYFTPSGRVIDHMGIMPDIEVRNEGKEDRQLTMAQSILKEALARANHRKSSHGREATQIDNGVLKEVGREMLPAPTLAP